MKRFFGTALLAVLCCSSLSVAPLAAAAPSEKTPEEHVRSNLYYAATYVEAWFYDGHLDATLVELRRDGLDGFASGDGVTVQFAVVRHEKRTDYCLRASHPDADERNRYYYAPGAGGMTDDGSAPERSACTKALRLDKAWKVAPVEQVEETA